MLNQTMPVASRTRGKREAQILKEYRKKKRREEEEEKNHMKSNMGVPAECSNGCNWKNTPSASRSKQVEEEPANVICIDTDDDDDTECSDDPVTSTSGEDNDDYDDLDYGGEDVEEIEEEQEQEEDQEVELVAESNAGETFQIYNRLGEPVGRKRKSKYEFSDGSLDDDADVEDVTDLTVSTPKRRGRKPKVKPSSSKNVDIIKVLTDSIWEKEDSDSTLQQALKEDIKEDSDLLPAKFTFGVEDKMAPEEADSDEEEMDRLWAEMQFCIASSELGSTRTSLVCWHMANKHQKP